MSRRALILFIPQNQAARFIGSCPETESMTFSINLFIALSASSQGDVEITGSQSDLIKIDENQSPVSEGLHYYKPLKRTSFKKKTTEPKGKTEADVV